MHITKIDSNNGTLYQAAGPSIDRRTTLRELMAAAEDLNLTFQKNSNVNTITYVYGATAEIQGLSFTISIHFCGNTIDYIFLKNHDGPASSADWDTINEDLLRKEVKILSEAMTNELQLPPKRLSSMRSDWKFSWGTVKVMAETRSFNCGVYVAYGPGAS